jgi:SpoVK/Ycf46/Vps4 family AAA+-type ATPase
MGATNRAIDIDAAFRRRMPISIFVGLPNKEKRLSIINLIIKKAKIKDQLDLEKIATQTEDFSGSELFELCRAAFMVRIREVHSKNTKETSMDNLDISQLRPLKDEDFQIALEQFRRSKNNLLFTF